VSAMLRDDLRLGANDWHDGGKCTRAHWNWSPPSGACTAIALGKHVIVAGV
jgi:hypothetical protein